LTKFKATADGACSQFRAIRAECDWQAWCFTPSDMSEPEDWWSTVDAETLRCLAEHGPMAPDELGKRLGMSEEAATSLVAQLVREGRARVCLVALAG